MTFSPKLRLLVAALAAILLLAQSGVAKVFNDVEMADAVQIADKSVALQGMGLREKFVFDVYVGGLYLATPTAEAGAAIKADEPKMIEMAFLRDVDAGKIVDAFAEGFEANTPAPSPELAARIKNFLALFTAEFTDGQRVTLTYEPGKGTTAVQAGKTLGTVAGADFMEALWAIWLGPKPADKNLKKGMLGLK